MVNLPDEYYAQGHGVGYEGYTQVKCDVAVKLYRPVSQKWSASVLMEALKTVIDGWKCGRANQTSDVCQKITT